MVGFIYESGTRCERGYKIVIAFSVSNYLRGKTSASYIQSQPIVQNTPKRMELAVNLFAPDFRPRHGIHIDEFILVSSREIHSPDQWINKERLK